MANAADIAHDLDLLVHHPGALLDYSIDDLIGLAGSQGVELINWIAARGRRPTPWPASVRSELRHGLENLFRQQRVYPHVAVDELGYVDIHRDARQHVSVVPVKMFFFHEEVDHFANRMLGGFLQVLAANDPACSSFTRNAAHQVTMFHDGYVNAGFLQFQGIQAGIDYSMPLPADLGRLDWRLSFLDTRKLTTKIASASPNEQSGELGALIATPRGG